MTVPKNFNGLAIEFLATYSLVVYLATNISVYIIYELNQFELNINLEQNL